MDSSEILKRLETAVEYLKTLPPRPVAVVCLPELSEQIKSQFRSKPPDTTPWGNTYGMPIGGIQLHTRNTLTAPGEEEYIGLYRTFYSMEELANFLVAIDNPNTHRLSYRNMKTLYKVVNLVVKTRTTQTEEEYTAALADGWCESEDEAKQGHFDKLFENNAINQGES